MAATEISQREVDKAKALTNAPVSVEYDKMISGMLYNSFVPELEEARFKARLACHNYNTTFPAKPEEGFAGLQKARAAALKNLLGFIADDEIFIEPQLQVDYGCNIRVGERFYANFNLHILDCALVTIGDRVMFGPNVTISTATHEIEVESRRANIEFAKPITIGDDCWVGANVTILAGVTIGEGCTIGAGAIVTKDVPAWSVAVGCPARVVKKVTPSPLTAKEA
ncbi:unnamed protein product [Clonostachys rosea f. rosea IK726]|uniref:Maltose/galactoside acetyltransferase domain-containing protein n=2 Tax=Bionectria ochroleuca TaxID=29856 RepID=A0A0B7KD59_BIOOC|nr:unnamed protein product [Clonostachys rosea f. rosea IK726]